MILKLILFGIRIFLPFMWNIGDNLVTMACTLNRKYDLFFIIDRTLVSKPAMEEQFL